jgi:hypothetical protein
VCPWRQNGRAGSFTDVRLCCVLGDGLTSTRDMLLSSHFLNGSKEKPVCDWHFFDDSKNVSLRKLNQNSVRIDAVRGSRGNSPGR